MRERLRSRADGQVDVLYQGYEVVNPKTLKLETRARVLHLLL